MIEKIKISLWDIFTFFSVGFMASAVIAVQLVAYGAASAGEIKQFFFEAPGSLSLFLLPLSFTILGMLIEPLANFVDKQLLDPLFNEIGGAEEKTKNLDPAVRNYIASKQMGPFNSKLKNKDPFFFCKEYVENHGLSASYMVFLSRYGFYRSAAFLCAASALATATCFSGAAAHPYWTALGWIALTYIFKLRSLQFYSYQAPAVYAAFAADRLGWRPRSTD